MAPSPQHWKHHRARVAVLSRDHGPDHPAVGEARRDLAAARLEEHIRKVADSAPPLTGDQRQRLIELLRHPSAGGSAA